MKAEGKVERVDVYSFLKICETRMIVLKGFKQI